MEATNLLHPLEDVEGAADRKDVADGDAVDGAGEGERENGAEDDGALVSVLHIENCTGTPF